MGRLGASANAAITSPIHVRISPSALKLLENPGRDLGDGLPAHHLEERPPQPPGTEFNIRPNVRQSLGLPKIQFSCGSQKETEGVPRRPLSRGMRHSLEREGPMTKAQFATRLSEKLKVSKAEG